MVALACREVGRLCLSPIYRANQRGQRLMLITQQPRRHDALRKYLRRKWDNPKKCLKFAVTIVTI